MDKIKKVFSPGKAQDDEIMYGTPSKEPTATSGSSQAPPSSTLETKPEAEQKDKGVLRQIFNPGGDKYSEQSYGTTATSQPGMADQLQKEPATQEPLKGAETAQYNDDKVQQVPYDSTTSGSTTRGPSTMAREDRQDDVSNATYTARSYALGSGHSADPQDTSTHVDQATRATTDLGPTGDEPSREHAGRRLDHSLAGAGVGGAGAGYVAQDELQEFMKHGRDPDADEATYRARDYYVGSSSNADPFERPGHELYNAEKGPAGLSSAGEEAPGHIPGEFPTEDGGDAHDKSSGLGAGAAVATGLGTGVAGAAASKAYNDRTTDSSRGVDQPSSPIQTTTNTMRPGSSSKATETATTDPSTEEKEKSSGFRGALAAATAAMGLGGAGAYAASRDGKEEPSSKTTEATQTTRSTGSSNVAPGSVVSEQTQSYAQHRPGYESSTAAPTSTSSSQARQPDTEDHSARNAALGTGALAGAGAGAYALNRDDNTATTSSSTANSQNVVSPSSSSSANPQSVVSPETQKYHRSHPGDNNSAHQSIPTSTSSAQPTASSQVPPTSQTQQPEDQTARNAALGTGALAGTGAGAYALSQQGNDDMSNTQSVVSPETQRYAGAHPSDTTSSSQGTGSTYTPSGQPQTSSQTQQPSEDHSARNAALGAGTLGAAGAGAYALGNRGNNNDTGNLQSVVSPETQKYHGSHPSDTTSSYQSSATAAPSDQTQPSSYSQQPRGEDHSAQNAALGAGAAGATGAGAYALSRDDDKPSNAQSVVSSSTQQYAGSHPDSSRSGGPIPSNQPITTSDYNRSAAQPFTTEPTEEDHTARNAALGAGGLGAAGAGAYYLSRDNDQAQDAQSAVSPETQQYPGTRPEPSRTEPTPVSKAEEPKESKVKETKPKESKPKETVVNKSKDPVSSTQQAPVSDYSRREPDPGEEDHTARNAALGAGGVGAAGAGAYYLSRDDDKTGQPTATSQPPTPAQYGSTGAGYGQSSDRFDDASVESSLLSGGSSTAYSSQSTAQPQADDHTVRNAALGTGGVGATGAGAYALGSDHGDTGPASKTLGPHESNAANVVDPRVQPEPTQQYERNTAGPYQSNIANKMDPRVTSDPAKAQQQEQGHDYGRDAGYAGGAAATGAAGYGAYQYANRDEPSQQQQYPTQSEHDPRIAAGSDGHNKLHKKGVDTEPQSSEDTEHQKKHGLMHKILHPREHKREKEEEQARRSGDMRRSYEQPAAASPTVASGTSGADPSYDGQARDDSVTEPHTGLPMNVDKYGTGAGGTDGGQQIEGYHGDRTSEGGVLGGSGGQTSSGLPDRTI